MTALTRAEGAGIGTPSRLPDGLERTEHMDRRHRGGGWPRRAVILLTLAFCALALANVFGQVASDSTANAAKAQLIVHSPDRLRGGLIFTSVVTVNAHQQFQDARLLFSPGWFSGMTLNALAPQSQQNSSNAQGMIFDYGQLQARQQMRVWISWQVNPTTVGGRSQDVALYDGATLVLSIRRSVVIFP